MKLSLMLHFSSICNTICHRPLDELSNIMKAKGNVIHFIFDKWISPSVKDGERNDCVSVKISFQVTGSLQKRPSNWLETMNNTSFKISLNKFLVEYWNYNALVDLIGKKYCMSTVAIHVTNVKLFRIVLIVVMRQDCTAITKKQIHACFFMFHVWLKIIVVPLIIPIVVPLIIAVGCFQKLLEKHQKLKLWLEMGVETKNTLRHVNVNQIYSSLGKLLFSALPAFHALFGCYYTAAFSRKGKVCPFRCLENSK